MRKKAIFVAERVQCIECGSIGYTASPEHVNCDQCGGKHKVIQEDYENLKPIKRFGIFSLLRLARG